MIHALTGDLRAEIAVIIPVYKQPELLLEAALSVLHQDCSANLVLVNDGCPFATTDEYCYTISAAWPERVQYVRQPNKGLAAARNAGIDVALSTWPETEALYFLDADNRLDRKTLQRMYAVLKETGAHWTFPDQAVFGTPDFVGVAGDYSVLELLMANFADAGSLVRSSVMRGEEQISMSDVKVSPTCRCVVVSSEPLSDAVINELKKAWIDPPIVCEVSLPVDQIQVQHCLGMASIFRCLLQATQNHRRLLARQVVESFEQIVALREELERHRSIVGEAGQSLCLDTVIEANDQVVKPSECGDSLRFELPYPCWAVRRMDLQFERCGAEGSLYVSLETSTNGKVVGQWALPYADIPAGWQSFPLAEGVLERGHGLKLLVHWSTNAGRAPGLRMSDVTVFPRGEAFIDIPVERVQLPAIRIWRGWQRDCS